jgi:hypothetical protein
MTSSATRPGAVRSAAWATALDAVGVVLFVAVGRRNHGEDSGFEGTLVTAAPFLLALGVAWLVVPRAQTAPASLRTGVGIWAVTAGLGLILRRVVFQRGIALPFVLVTIGVLGAVLLGWRAVVTYLRRGR